MTNLRALLARDTKSLTLNMASGVVDDGFYIPYQTSWNAAEEKVDTGFDSYVSNIYKGNSIVFSCIQVRALPFSEARFQYQRFNSGRPGDLFGDASLALLEKPWPNGTTGELLQRMEQDSSLAGNCYLTTVGVGTAKRIRRLRPDWVTIASGVRGDPDASPYELDAEVLFYLYAPPSGGSRRAVTPVMITPANMVHYSPIPDPDAQWRGMSWLTPVLREISADNSATTHKLKMFSNGGTPPFALKYDKTIDEAAFRRAVALFKELHTGPQNAYKVLHLMSGADPVSISANLQQLDFRAVQGAGETRIAAAAGVGAIIARFSEGLQGSSLNQGNYAAAKRQFADMTLRPLWRTAAAALSKFAAPPDNTRLWYDARDVAFLAEDEKDAATILSTEATTIGALVTNGWDADSAVRAVQAGDLALLIGKHNGLPSVQQQPTAPAPAPSV